MMKRILVGILLALVLLILPVMPALAAPGQDQDITVTATPAFVQIENTPGAWVINDVADAGGKSILNNTIYYSNPLGDTAIPSNPVDAGECRFTIDNTSTATIDLTVNFPDHTGGDASANSNTGANDVGKFGAKSYFVGKNFSAAVIAKSSLSDPAYEDLAPVTGIKWGLMYESQEDVWTSGAAMSSTVNIAATPA